MQDLCGAAGMYCYALDPLRTRCGHMSVLTSVLGLIRQSVFVGQRMCLWWESSDVLLQPLHCRCPAFSLKAPQKQFMHPPFHPGSCHILTLYIGQKAFEGRHADYLQANGLDEVRYTNGAREDTVDQLPLTDEGRVKLLRNACPVNFLSLSSEATGECHMTSLFQSLVP